MTIQAILDSKGTNVATIAADARISIAANMLKLKGIGALVVSSDGVTPQGILTERDIVYGLAEHGAAVPEKTVADVMSRHVVTCAPDTSIKSAMRLITQQRARHIVVVRDGRMRGIVSIGDVMKNRLDDLELEGNVLHDYIVAHN
jgi:CBS domain-containing protein